VESGRLGAANGNGAQTGEQGQIGLFACDIENV